MRHNDLAVGGGSARGAAMSMFEGRLALVTGASRGIGAAIAETCAALGGRIVLTGRSDEAVIAVEANTVIAPAAAADVTTVGRATI